MLCMKAGEKGAVKSSFRGIGDVVDGGEGEGVSEGVESGRAKLDED